MEPPSAISEESSLLAAARRDFLAFHLLAERTEAPEEVMFFLAQQAVEKVLKAVLAHRRIAFRRTHDLIELSSLLSDRNLQELFPEELMIRLAPYAVEMRYTSIASPKVRLDEVTRAVTNLLEWAQVQVQQ